MLAICPSPIGFPLRATVQYFYNIVTIQWVVIGINIVNLLRVFVLKIDNDLIYLQEPSLTIK